MASAPALLSLDEYPRTSYKPDVHFVDGELEERNGGDYSHSKTQQFITELFSRNEVEWNIDAVIEQRVLVSPTRVRIPDITVLRVSDPHEEVVTRSPLFCIEVLFPEDRLSRRSACSPTTAAWASPTPG